MKCDHCDKQMRLHGSTYGWTCWTAGCPRQYISTITKKDVR